MNLFRKIQGFFSSPSPQDVVNVVGGIGVLLPLLEQVSEAEQVCNAGQEISDLLGPELTSSRGPAAMLLPLNKSAGWSMPGIYTFTSAFFAIYCFLLPFSSVII